MPAFMRGQATRIATILAVALTVLVAGSLAASAQTTPPTYPPPTTPSVAVAPAEVSPAVVGAAGGGGQPSAPQAELAFTGAELTVLLIVLGGLVLGGVALYAAGRRRARGSEA